GLARLGRGDDLGGGETDALVDDLHADGAAAGGDLFGAVGMPIEPGLANEEGELAAELLRKRLDVALDRFGVFAAGFDHERNAGRAAIFAIDLSQRVRPFAGCDAGFGGRDRGGHDVPAGAGVGLERFERAFGAFGVARAAPGLEARDLLGL